MVDVPYFIEFSLSHSAIVPVKVTASLPTVGVGQDVIFRCRGIEPRGDNDIPQNFIWIYERQGTEVRLLPIENRLEIETNISALTSTLTLRTVMLSDGGTFTCKTSNPDQQSIQANDSVTLIVEGRPGLSSCTVCGVYALSRFGVVINIDS